MCLTLMITLDARMAKLMHNLQDEMDIMSQDLPTAFTRANINNFSSLCPSESLTMGTVRSMWVRADRVASITLPTEMRRERTQDEHSDSHGTLVRISTVIDIYRLLEGQCSG